MKTLSIIKYDRKTIEKQSNRRSRIELVWLFIFILTNCIFYIFTYYKKNLIIEDGEGIAYCLEFAWIMGFLILYQIIRIGRRLKPEIVDIEEDTTFESGFLGSYKYNSFLEIKWSILMISGLLGAINVIIYGFFLFF